MIRGELWLVAGGVYASKPRPAVILQDDRCDVTESVTVVPLTTTQLSAPLLRVSVAANEHNGLDLDSCVMIDKLTTVRRVQVTTRIGRLSTAIGRG